MASTVQNCDKFGTVSVNGAMYVVHNNVFGSDETQCIEVDNVSGDFKVIESHANNPTDNYPASFLFINKGCHYGNDCTRKSDFPPPVKVGNITSIISNWNTVQPANGTYNAAYDIWFNKSSDVIPGQRPDGAELMIWLRYQGNIQPDGTRVSETVSIAGEIWDVWENEKNKVVTYVKKSAVASVSNFNVALFISDAVTRGMIYPEWYLVSIEAGFEIWKDGTGLQSKSFSVEVNAPLPTITANGISNLLTVSQSTPVSISVSLEPASHDGQNADWWIVADTPFGWFSYVYPGGWSANVELTIQAPLFKLFPAFEVLKMNLPPGEYTFYFAVDMSPDRNLNTPVYYDTVQVDVMPL